MGSNSRWVCGSYSFSLSSPLIMGILNVTPDSFSDGGCFNTPATAIERGLRLFDDGADIVDVGGESTRPGSDEVSITEELERALPVVSALSERGIPVSIDTRHEEVARQAIEAGAAIVNDVTGFCDPYMISHVAKSGVGAVMMHMQGAPKTMQNSPEYTNVTTEVRDFLLQRSAQMETGGVLKNQIMIDPGFGFGKTLSQNCELLQNTEVFVQTGYPVMVAVSRKRTIGELSGVEVPDQRVAGSVAAALFALERGAVLARVHDVAETKQAFDVYSRLLRGE